MTPEEAAAKLTPAQRRALLQDEYMIEHLPFMDRDTIISLGIACRAWPEKHTSDGSWRTWLTPFGVEVRRVLVPGWGAN